MSFGSNWLGDCQCSGTPDFSRSSNVIVQISGYFYSTQPIIYDVLGRQLSTGTTLNFNQLLYEYHITQQIDPSDWTFFVSTTENVTPTVGCVLGTSYFPKTVTKLENFNHGNYIWRCE